MSKISVIVPVYNVEKYLPECLDSIISQTLTDIEIICINDGSPDNSLSILKDYAAKDSRIKIIDKENEGVGKARNDGIRAADGEFIAFMDSDDYYPSSNVLETLYFAAVQNNMKIAGGRKIMIFEDGKTKKDEFPLVELGLEFASSAQTSYKGFEYDYGYWQYIFSREMLIENNCFFPPYRRFQDPPFFVNAMILAGEFYAADIDSYCYRQLPSAAKYTISKTLDFLCGITDNLNVSRENGLAKLHYLSAMRLDKEGSFMAIQNLFDAERSSLVSTLMKATAAVDVKWLRENGYDIPDPFVPEVFEYAISTAEKYEKIRNNKAFKAAAKFLNR